MRRIQILGLCAPWCGRDGDLILVAWMLFENSSIWGDVGFGVGGLVHTILCIGSSFVFGDMM